MPTTNLKSKIAYVTQTHFDFINSSPINFSKFVRQAIEEEMKKGGNDFKI